VTIVVNAILSGVYVTSATVSSSATDPNSANNSGNATTTVSPPNVNIVAAGASLGAESFSPANGGVDIGETVTVTLRLRNAGNVANTNLVATLLATNGVTSPSGPQIYGQLQPSGLTIGKDFSFTATGTPGGTVSATLQLQDGASSLGLVAFNFALPNTVTFSNTAAITIPDSGAASPYPSTINVSGITGLVGKVTVTLSNLNHSFIADVDALLYGPNGQKVMLMSDAGNPNSVANTTVTFDDAGATLPENGQILATAYAPADYETGDAFPGPAPVGPYGTALSSFNGNGANGDWKLFIVDDFNGDGGSVAGGWSLSLTTISPVNQIADLALSGVGVPNPALVGSSLTYTFTVTNVGPNAATSVAFTNVVPAGATLLAASSSQGSTTTNGNTVIASLGSIIAGSVATVTVTVTPTAAGSLINTASVGASENDLNPANNSASITTTVNLPVADVVVSKSAPTNAVLGSNLTFTVTVTNNGPQTALNVLVSDPLPAGLTFVSATDGATNSAGTVFAPLGNLGAGSARTFTVTATAASIGSLTNIATASTGSSDTNSANNSAKAIIVVTAPAPNIVPAGASLVTENHQPPNGSVDNGESVTVSLALSNNGTANTANLIATLQSGGGVTSPGGSQNYGALTPGGPAASRNFSFTGAGTNGGVVTATLQLQDGPNNLGTVAFTFS
ncbi:MAG TPA: DUF11 domain-containing protein, partial [Verrucomicrobiae bacterium]